MAYTSIDNPELYFQVKTYTGTGSENAITLDGSEDMAPDLVWVKCRSNAENHPLHDSVRGATKTIHPDTTDYEYAVAQGLKSFGSDGFTLGTSNFMNQSGRTFVAWCWKAGGSSSSNSDGDITTTISANTTSGISICKYSGNGSNDQELGHGMNKIPDMWLIKRIDSASSPNWVVGAKPLGFDDNYMFLNTNDAAASSINSGTGTPTTSVFFVGDHASVNASGATYISYVFSSVQGFSKVGSYTGNGNNDGPMVFTGFRPAWVICKGTASNREWVMHDNKRDAENVVDGTLYANTTDAEGTGTAKMDFLSNGFKLREDGNNWNASGETYVYIAFAEAPFVNSNGVPGNAR